MVRLAVLLTVAFVGSSCYTVHIDESFWLRARPGPAADLDALQAAAPAGYELQQVRVTSANGQALLGVLALHRDAVATVIFFGADDFIIARSGAETISALGSAAPLNVLLVDYAGYGPNAGPPGMDRLKLDALSVHDWVLKNAALASVPMIVHGHSMGSFVAAHVADQRPVHGLVLQGSATSPDEWRRSFLRWSRFKWWARPAYPFLRFRIDPALQAEDNTARVARLTAPLLLLAGSRDDITAPAMSRALYDAAATQSGNKSLVVLDGAGHLDMLQHADFRPSYGRFVRAVVAGR